MPYRDLLRPLRDRAAEFDERFQVFLDEFQSGAESVAARLGSAKDEGVMQRALEEHPLLLLNAIMGGFFNVASLRCALFPKLKLGECFETDFAFVSANSMGAWWVFVEIESPGARLFNKNGDVSSALSHAVRQVTDWRAWIRDHGEYACSRLSRLQRLSDLHYYPEFRREPQFLIVIGRRASLTADSNRRRVELCNASPHLEIITYDRLVDPYGTAFVGEPDATGDEMRIVSELAPVNLLCASQSSKEESTDIVASNQAGQPGKPHPSKAAAINAILDYPKGASMDLLDLADIGEVAETRDYEAVNNYLKLGWVIINVHTIGSEIAPGCCKQHTIYCLGWHKSLGDCQYPEGRSPEAERRYW